MTTNALPNWASDILSAVPKRGEGLNRWLMSAAVALRANGRADDEILTELGILTIGEEIKPGEIDRAVKRSADYLDKGRITQRQAATKWPSVDDEARASVIAQHDAGTVELWEQSPFRFDDEQPASEAIIDALFPGNPLICTANALETASTAPHESFRGKLSSLQFIVPSAMTKPIGINQEGRESARCLDNTGPRQYQVVEMDSGTADEQAAVIMHLAEQVPLVLVVRSGGKSLHAWFACGQQPESIVKTFFLQAVRLGADRATWTRCQLVRMPDGTRHKPDGITARQSVLYWNPEITEGAR